MNLFFKRIPRKDLILVLLIASFLRLYQLGSVPPSPSLDEVSIGYNAYSILKTGADEYGTKFPLLLRAYDDWRPALYVYLVVPSVALFGLSAFAVRIPSVILSVLSVASVYFITQELLKKSKIPHQLHKLMCFSSSLFLAISPWHIYISRLGHEANAGLAFLIFALLFTLRTNIISSFIFLSLSFMSYQSEKIVVPLVGLASVLYMWPAIKKHFGRVAIALVISGLITVPFLIVSLQPEALIRFEATNILKAREDLFIQRSLKLAESVERRDWIGTIMNNRRVVASQLIWSQYISHFNPIWLTTNRGAESHKVPHMGILYRWELTLFLIGIYAAIRWKLSRSLWILLLVWFFAAPIPAAITTQAPHVMRSFTFLPMWQLGASFGAAYLWYQFRRSRNTVVIVGSLIIGVSFYQLFTNYFLIFPKEQSDSFQYSLSRAIPAVQKIEGNYDKIVVSNENNLYQSYMFYLFTTQYDPWLYKNQGGTRSGGYAESHTIGKYTFTSLSHLPKKELSQSILYVGNVSDFNEQVQPLSVQYNKSGQATVKLVDSSQLK